MAKSFRNIYSSQSCYFDGKLHALNEEGELISSAKPIVILSRKLYSEYTKRYPTVSSKEISKLIKLECQLQSDDFHLSWHITKHTDACTVCFYKYKKVLLPWLWYKVWFVVPESLLLGNLLSGNQANQIGELFVVSNNGVIQSSYPSPTIANIDRFAEAMGVSDIVGKRELFPALELAIEKCPLNLLSGHFNRALKDWVVQFDFRPLLIGSGLSACFYLAITSAWITLKQEQVESQLQSLQSEVGPLLALGQGAESNNEHLSTINALIESRRYTLPIWRVLAPVFVNGGKGISLRLQNDGSYMVGMDAPEANEVLKLLSTDKLVANVSFSGEVQSFGKRQRFTLKIVLSDV